MFPDIFIQCGQFRHLLGLLLIEFGNFVVVLLCELTFVHNELVHFRVVYMFMFLLLKWFHIGKMFIVLMPDGFRLDSFDENVITFTLVHKKVEILLHDLQLLLCGQFEERMETGALNVLFTKVYLVQSGLE